MTNLSLSLARRLLLVALAAWLAAPAAHAADPKASRFYEDALRLYEKKDLPGAIIQLKNVLQIDPSVLAAQVLLGKALLQNGEAVPAEVALHEALRLGVSRVEVVIPLGQAYIAQAKQKQLLEDKVFQIAGLPPNVTIDLLLLRAAATADLGDSRTALKLIEDARAIDARAPNAWLAEVPVRVRARQFREAGLAVDRAMGLAPNQAAVWYQKASLFHVTGDMKSALAAYDRVLQIDAAHVDARVARAGLYVDLRRFEDAARDVAEIQRTSPQEPRAAYLKAELAFRAGKGSEARVALGEVTGLIDPVPLGFLMYRPQLLMLNGMAHFELGELEKAKPYLELFQRSQPNSPVAKLMAQIYFRESAMARGIDVLEVYLRAQPFDQQALNMLASAHMQQGRHAKAAALIQEALKAGDSPQLRTTLGMSMATAGNTRQGIGELETVFKRDPTQTQAGMALTTLYLRAGNADKAIPVAETLTRNNPANAALFNLLGLARAQSGNGPAARVAFERALKIEPSLVVADINIARLDSAMRNYAAATARLGEVLKRDERNMEAMHEMAVVLERSGKPTEAQRWLEKATELSGPSEVRWGLELVDYHLRHNRPSDALEIAKRMTAKAPESLVVALAYGRAQLALGDTIGARITFTGATRFADYNAPMQAQIAKLQIAANNPDGALYNLEKALAGQPDYLPANIMMAEVEIRRGEFVKAEARAKDVIVREPRRAVGYGLLGDIAFARGQNPGAIEHYRRAHQIQPSSQTLLRLFQALNRQDGKGQAGVTLAEQWLRSNPREVSVYTALGDFQASRGNYPAARQAYEAVIKVAPTNGPVLNNLANVLLRLKSPDAVNVAEQAVKVNPGSADAIDTHGWALLEAGQTDRALQLLRDARLRDPANPEIRYHLAVALAKIGRRTEAREELQAALTGNRRFESASAARALLASLP